MSNALAIAAVTAVLKDLLDNGLKALNVADIVGGDVTVSVVPPDRVNTSGTEDPTQLNLFLHRTSLNQGWRNVDLPSGNSNGDRIANPPLALDLHYLLTAYGPKNFYPEIILGHAMQLLHETPVLTRDSIRKALSPSAPPADFPTAFATCELADQVEQLRITPEPMNTEEVSKLWTAIQAHYRTMASYQVTVVLIQSKRSAKSALPVAARNLYVLPFRNPVIDRVISGAGEIAPITANSALSINGRQLRGAVTKVLIGGFDLTLSVTQLGDTEITLPLPAVLPAGLFAGVQLAQVIHLTPMGTPESDHRGNESNVAAFILRPIIAALAIQGPVKTIVDDDGVTFNSGQLKVDFNPKVAKTQRVVLLLNELNAPESRPPRAYTFQVPAGNGVSDPDTDTASIEIAFKRVQPGDYVTRVRVDGAESLLAVDGSGNYATPMVTI